MRGQRLVWLLLAVGAFIVFYGNLGPASTRPLAGAASPSATGDAAGSRPQPGSQMAAAVIAEIAQEAEGKRRSFLQPPEASRGQADSELAGPPPTWSAPEDRQYVNGDPNDWCDKLIPRYDIREWEAKHTGQVPDHPAVFTGTDTREDDIFHDLEAFLAAHGDHQVTALPEYAQAGGHLAYIGINVKGETKARLVDLAKDWNRTHLYYNDFKCSPLCQKVVAMFGTPNLFNAPSTVSTNFLIGGPESGLPFHKHSKTWQGLSVGRKAWYVVPAGSMSEAVHDSTGPYIFPVRSYHHAMQRLPVGQRPLYCVQHPGEIFYIPDNWWHATMNLDSFQLAFGAKPCCLKQLKDTAERAAVMEAYPRQPWDTSTDGGFGWERPFPYSIIPRVREVERACNGEQGRSAMLLEEPLRRMEHSASKAAQENEDKGLTDTAAFAHCVLAKKAKMVLKKCIQPDQVKQELIACTERWRRVAANLSSSVYQSECQLSS